MPKLKYFDFSAVSQVDLAYLAGLIDGEGCFFIGNFMTKSKTTGNMYPNYHCILKISSNDVCVLEWVNKTFGARITVLNKKRKDHTRNFVTYDAYFTGNMLTDLTHLLLPHLKIKKPQAEVMLKMRATFPRSGSSGRYRCPERDSLRAALHRDMHRLNSRFKQHPLKSDLYLTLAPCCPSVLSSEEFQVDQGRFIQGI
jgi:hypothetical protein